MKPSCIFDMDGVLVDTADYHFESWRKLADHLGFVLADDMKEHLKGISRMASLAIVLDNGGIQVEETEKENLASLKNEWYIESLNEVGDEVVLPGVVNFLHHLRDIGVKFAVGSASRNAAITLKCLGLDDLFVSIVDGNDVLHTKPNPEVFRNAARDLQYKEADCIVFEDSQKGIKAAKAGGFFCVGIGDRNALKAADIVITGIAAANYGHIVATMKG